MKKILLSKDIGFYKAQLHTHTIVSDGLNTPEKVKELYKSKGYSVVAFSDHDVLCAHNDLKDESFLPLTAYEADLGQPIEFSAKVRAYHFNLFAKDENNQVSPVFSKRKCWIPHMLDYVAKEQFKVEYEVPYSVDGANQMIKTANDNGFFVMLNHPTSWSILNHDEYYGLEGLWGIEVFNYAGYCEGKEDSELPFQEMLVSGKNVFPICSDDSHTNSDVGGSFTMIQSTKLEYNAIINALLKGDFYSSYGPEIYELSIDNGFICLKTSEIVNVFTVSDIRAYSRFYKDGNEFTEAKISLKEFIDNDCRYFRLVLVDKKGNKAFTRAYYLKDVLEYDGK